MHILIHIKGVQLINDKKYLYFGLDSYNYGVS